MTQKCLTAPIVFDKPHPHELHLPPRPGPHPLIIITPLLGRLIGLKDLFLEKNLARFFSHHNFSAALIHRPIFEFNPSSGLEQIDRYLSESLERARTILETLSRNPAVDPARIGTFGMSFGAIVNCLWSASDSRFKAHVFALPGGDLPEIFVRSRDPLMRSYFKAALKQSGLTPEGLKNKLRKIFFREPLTACTSSVRDRTLMILALFDRVVPFSLGLALRKKMGEPETLFLPLGHYTSILALPLLRRHALRFFQKKLSG